MVLALDESGWSAVGALAAVFVAVIALVVAIVEAVRTQSDRQTQRYFDFREFLAREDFMDARRSVRGMSTDPAGVDAKDANRACACYDQAGIMVRLLRRKDRDEFLKSSWGLSIIDQYQLLDGYLSSTVSGGRTEREFFHHFNDLYLLARTAHGLTVGP